MMICILISLIILLISVGGIASAISHLADANQEIAKQIHVHAEVMTEIKHQGIGIDNTNN